MASPAGLSCLYPWATVHCMTELSRCRTRFAVSGFSCHMGVSTAKNVGGRDGVHGALAEAWETRRSSRVACHCAACFSLRQDGRFSSKTAPAASAKVGTPRSWSRPARGSPPARAFLEVEGHLSGFGKTDEGIPAVPHFSGLALDHETLNP